MDDLTRAMVARLRRMADMNGADSKTCRDAADIIEELADAPRTPSGSASPANPATPGSTLAERYKR